MNTKNKVVIITGASGGIGEAAAKTPASKGAKVILVARRKDKLEKVTADITSKAGSAEFYVADVTNKEKMVQQWQRPTAEYRI